MKLERSSSYFVQYFFPFLAGILLTVLCATNETASVTTARAQNADAKDLFSEASSPETTIATANYSLRVGSVGARRQSAWSLTLLGKEASPAQPVLLAALHDNDAVVRKHAIYSLATFATSDTLNAHVRPLLSDVNIAVRRAAAYALSTEGEQETEIEQVGNGTYARAKALAGLKGLS